MQQEASRQPQALALPALRTLRDAAVHAQAGSFQQKLVAALQVAVPEVLAGAWAAWLLPDWVQQEILLAVPPLAQQLVLESAVEAAAQSQASLPQQEQQEVEAQLELAQARQEQEEARQPQEVAVEAVERQQQARQVSCAPLWLRLLLPPCPLLLFVPPQFPHRQARENVRAPLPLRLLQSSWSAFFSR